MKNPARFVLVNSSVQADILFRPAVIYQLKRHGKVVLELWFYPFERRLEAILEGGISIKGPILPMDLHVYDYGKEVAKLEPAPELSCFVFRFPDGTRGQGHPGYRRLRLYRSARFRELLQGVYPDGG